MDKTVKYISFGIRENTPSNIKKSHFYLSWKAKLKQAHLKPKTLILDKVDQSEELFWLEYYNDLFKTWGFRLWTNVINEQIYEASRYNTFEVQRYLKAGSVVPTFHRKVLNLENLVRLLKTLMSNSFKAKEVDDFCLLIILVFFYRMSLSEISRLTVLSISMFIQKCEKTHELFRFDKLELFISTYTFIHLETGERNNYKSPINIEIPSAKAFNRKLSDVFSYFGFNQSFNYFDRELISKLVTFKTHVRSNLDKKVLESVFEIDENHLRYELINRTKSKYVIVSDDIHIFRQVLCLEP